MTEKIERREERPDAAGVVRRGSAVGFRGYVERYGEPPPCFVGSGPDKACQRPAVMEVYGLAMCELHGEEAAAGAIEEIAYDLEQELQRPMNAHVRDLSPHLEAALNYGFGSLPQEAHDREHADAALLAAFPLDRSRVDAETLAYAENLGPKARAGRLPPSDIFSSDRLLLCRHMRLAFEADADWLVEMLERERESVAAQVAYALALEREAGLDAPPGGE